MIEKAADVFRSLYIAMESHTNKAHLSQPLFSLIRIMENARSLPAAPLGPGSTWAQKLMGAMVIFLPMEFLVI